MLVELTFFALLALGVSLGLNQAMLRLGPSLGLMDEPGERRIHAKAIPRAGGIAIWLTFLLVATTGMAMGWIEQSGSFSKEWLGAFAAGSLVLMVAGFLDDRKGLPPLVKLAAHVLAPMVFFLLKPVATGLFPADWPRVCDFAVFVVWVVVLINAFNLIDGLDGLCGGLAAVASIALAGMALMNDRTDSALLLVIMGGALLGFLKYNLNPARIFLGDAGSMLMGFFLATAATDAVGRRAVVGVMLLPIAVAGVPLLDVLLAIWRRGARRFVKKLRGEPTTGIFDADSEHLHHRLLASQGSQRKVAVILHGISIVLAMLAFLPMLFGDRVFGLTLVGLLVVAMVGVRHLARVEIEHTGSVIHMAIKLPGHRRRVAAALFAYDLLVLAVAAMAAVIVETNFLTRDGGVMEMGKFVLLFAVFGCLATLVAKVHLRLWVRATMRDILALQFWLLVAAMATFTAFSLGYVTLEWSALRMTLIAYVFACMGVCLPRVLLDVFREFGLEARHRSPAIAAEGHGPVVVLGAGDLGTLLLDHLKSSAHDEYPGMRVLGFIDETRLLHGRHLRSFRILGGLSVVPKLAEEEGLKGIVLAINRPRREMMEQLEELAARYQLRIYRWRVGLVEDTSAFGEEQEYVPEEQDVAMKEMIRQEEHSGTSPARSNESELATSVS